MDTDISTPFSFKKIKYLTEEEVRTHILRKVRDCWGFYLQNEVFYYADIVDDLYGNRDITLKLMNYIINQMKNRGQVFTILLFNYFNEIIYFYNKKLNRFIVIKKEQILSNKDDPYQDQVNMSREQLDLLRDINKKIPGLIILDDRIAKSLKIGLYRNLDTMMRPVLKRTEMKQTAMSATKRKLPLELSRKVAEYF